MLARKNYIFLAVQASVAIGLLSGCVITSSPTGSGGTSGDTTVTSAAATTGGGGQGGAGVSGSTSGTGGSVACVPETGVGVVADCNNLNITPKSGGGAASSSCGDTLDQDPPGYGLCQRGFNIFNAGAATNLVACLGTIGVQDQCNIPPLQVCIDKMFVEECVIASIGTLCGEIKTTCVGDPFNTDTCAKDLNPFSDAGLKELSDCINATDPAISCQAAFDACYNEVLTF